MKETFGQALQVVVGHMLYLMEDVDKDKEQSYHVFMKNAEILARYVVQLRKDHDRDDLSSIVAAGEIARGVEIVLAENAEELEIHFLVCEDGQFFVAKSMVGNIETDMADAAQKAHDWLYKGIVPVDLNAPVRVLH